MAQPVAEFVGLGKDGKLVDIALLLDVSSKYCRRMKILTCTRHFILLSVENMYL